jgi:hypothetical protein
MSEAEYSKELPATKKDRTELNLGDWGWSIRLPVN